MNNHQGLPDGYCVGATPDSNVKAGLYFLLGPLLHYFLCLLGGHLKPPLHF